MKVGIIIHSHSGNTLLMAQNLSEALTANGHQPSILRVSAVDENPSAKQVALKDAPDTAEFDMLVFGAPVRAFSLSPVMRLYLEQLPSLAGKKVGLFITQHFPYRWMGGNNALRQMKTACEAKGCLVYGTGIVNWSSKQREQRMAEVTETLLSFRS